MQVEEELEFLETCGCRLSDRALNSIVKRWLKVRDKNGDLVALKPNRMQREFADRYGKRNIVLKARQLGMTTYVAARFFVKTILIPGTLTVQVAHDQESAEGIFRIVHRYLANLPASLQRGALTTSRANVKQIVFPWLDSEYRVETAADPDAGRGLTIQNLHCSEVARWPGDAEETLASLRAAVPQQGEIVLESTPYGVGGPFYDEWQRAAETGYVRHFFPWWMDEGYRAPGDVRELTAEERELMERHGLDLQQLAYRRTIKANFGRRAPQEYAEDAETCFLASGECVFELKAIEERMLKVGRPIEERDNGRLQVWLPPATGAGGAPREYIIGVDAAGGGTNGDYACAQVIDRASGMQCAELYGHISPQELARKAAMLGREYHEALIGVECNNHGHAVLAHLAASEHYENVYARGGREGWLTNSVTRPRMIETLSAVLSAQPELFNSARLLQECRTFTRQADGRAEAMAGTHDDAVMAMAVALAVREESAGQRREIRHSSFDGMVLGDGARSGTRGCGLAGTRDGPAL